MFKYSVHAGRVSAVALAAIATLTLVACDDTSRVDDPAVAQSDLAASPAIGGNGDWITIDGVIAAKFPEQFALNYGTGTINVEVDDWDKALEGVSLLPGDRVSVTGRVDDDLFETASIEASSVYLHNLNTVYYASGADEEDLGISTVPQTTPNSIVDYTGWVTGTDANGFSLGAGPTLIKVNTSGIDTALARSGLSSGDRVYVWGDLTLKKGESVLIADGLLRLVDGGKKAAPRSAAAGATASPSATGAEMGKSSPSLGAASPVPTDSN